MIYSAYIDNTTLNMNMCSYGDTYGFTMLSCFGYKYDVIKASKAFTKKGSIRLRGYYFRIEPDTYKIYTSKVPNSEYYHLLVSKKDEISNVGTQGECLELFVYYISKNNDTKTYKDSLANGNPIYPEMMIDKLYQKLQKYSPIYIKKEWMRYILKRLPAGSFIAMKGYNHKSDEYINSYRLNIYTSSLKDIISSGLKNKEIVINTTEDKTSDFMKNLSGLDNYLNRFTDQLASKIKESFKPAFVPGQDKYNQEMVYLDEFNSYVNHIDYFEAQKSVIQAVANTLKDKRAAFIVSEMGTGKTIMGASAALVHFKGLNYSRGLVGIVMSPSHLVSKWKRELEREIPLSRVYIISDITDVMKIENVIKEKKHRENIWLVISYETAKNDAFMRPAAVWNRRRNLSSDNGCYVCPECGQPLYTEKTVRRRTYREYFGVDAFLKQVKTNSTCPNEVRYYDSEEKRWKKKPCGAKLWSINSKGNGGTDWIKFGEAGWLEGKNVSRYLQNLLDKPKLTSTEIKAMNSCQEYVNDDVIPVQMAPVKMAVARYILKYLKDKIDYAIFDEVHKLSGGNSLQGEAFGNIARAAKRNICLTGTLLNGKAESVFFPLMRIFPNLMKKEGFDYSNASQDEFTREYGVYENTQFTNASDPNKTKKTFKVLPGVSPLVFTKFLLENAVFTSLNDMSEGLPGYREIPVGVDMDPVLETEYTAMAEIAKALMRDRTYAKSVSSIAELLLVYPDQPYNQKDIIDAEDGTILLSPPSLPESITRNKEGELLRIIREKKAKGEKVLVYNAYPGRVDLENRVNTIFAEDENNEAIKYAILTASDIIVDGKKKRVKARERENAILECAKDVDVLVCNPSLVETGLDLLDFTTIVYYQTGYNLSTMRQASRRSWRLSQTKDIEVYFLYYRNTSQQIALSLMASKLQAAMAIEGKFSEEGLNAMSNNQDILNQIASAVADNISEEVNTDVFSSSAITKGSFVDKVVVENLLDKPRNTVYDKIDIRYKRSSKHCFKAEERFIENPALLLKAV